MSTHVALALTCIALAIAVTVVCYPCYLRDRRQQQRENEARVIEEYEREWEDAA